MPEISDATGVPSVNPDVRGIAVRADASNFGGQIGQGLEALGEGATKAQTFYGQVAADDANNAYMDGAAKIRARVTALSGKAALDALPQAQEDLDSLYQDTRDTLWSPESKLNFDSISRRYRSNTSSDIQEYGAAQSKVYAKETNAGTIELAKNMAGQAQIRNDPAGLAHALDLMRSAYGKNADIDGLDGAAKASKVLDADRDFASSRILAALPTDPMGAKKILDTNQSVLVGTPEYESLSRQVESGVTGYLTATMSQPQARAAAAPSQPSVGAGARSSEAPQPYNIGNVKSAGGGYVVPASPTDGVILAANNLRDGYQGMTVGDIGKKWAPESDHNDPVEWANTVSKVSGIPVGAVPDLNNPDQLKAIVKGISVAEKSAQDRGNFGPDVIDAGVTASLAGKHAAIGGGGGAQPGSVPNFDYKHADGMIDPGNLDPWHRPVLHNPDGSYSTTSSFSIGTDKGETLIPSVVDGKRLSQADAIAHFKKTGENLGTFSSPDTADKFATDLHNAQATMFDQHGNPVTPSQGNQGGSDDAYLATVRTRAEAAGLSPAGVESVVKGVETNIKRDDSEQIQTTEAHTQDAIAYLSSGGDASKVALTPEQVRANIPGQRGDTLATELEAAQHYNTATKQLATAPQADVDKIITAGPVAKSLKGGAGDFDIHTKEENAIYSAAVARQKEIYGSGNTPGDPSGYVMRNFPDVALAFSAVTSPGANAASFQAYAQKTMSAQAALGIPADARRIMPRVAAVGTVTQLMTGDPAKVLPTLQGLRNEAGSYWPQMYSDLARAGLPPAYQALSVVNDQDAGVMAAALSRDAESRRKTNAPMVDTMRGISYDDGSGGAPKSVATIVDQSLSKDGGLTNLRATYGIFGRAGASQFDGIYDAVRTTAFYLFQTRGVTPDVAAQTAAKMVTSPFDFVTQPGHPPVRLQKGATDNFRGAAASVLDTLKADDLRPYLESSTQSGEAIAGQTDQELRDQTLQGAKHAYWISVPGADGRGAIRAMDPQSGQPVTLKNGKPLDVPFSRMQWLAQEAAHKRVVNDSAGQVD